MIYTVTLNPALDLELSVPSIQYGQVLRAAGVRADCGGKGFNISRALRALGVESVALGWIGGKTGERLSDELVSLGIHTDLTRVSGETRTNVHILEQDTGRYIKVNQPGASVEPGECNRMLEKMKELAQSGDLWLLTGSLPPGAPADLYAVMIRVVHRVGALALVDADGETLREACKAAPYLVKPNALEAGMFAGFPVANPQDAQRAADAFHAEGVKAVLVTLGEQGAVLSQDGCAWWARPPQIPAGIPTGAGDAAMAGYAWGLSRGVTPPEALRLAVASGTASASLPGTAVAERELVEAVAKGVEVARLR